MIGYLRMMSHENLSPVTYYFRTVEYSTKEKNKAEGELETKINLNELLGKKIKIEFLNEIRCVSCGAITKKSFNSGACYKCFITLAENDLCILKPETCHFHLGTCREPEWGKTNCFKKHIVYLANTSGLKVGITKENPYHKRWVDQGAVEALPILETGSRFEAGKIEIEFAKYISDKTSWQKLISAPALSLDLMEKSKELFTQVNLEKTNSEYKKLSHNVTKIEYPILDYPKKKISLKLEANKPIEDILLGIKGQYLLFPNGGINLRSFEGYKISFSA